MKVELISITQDAEKIIEQVGRTAYQSQAKITDDSATKFIKMLIGKGHTSVLECCSASFRISDVSRAFSHQLVRHRIASYTQKSQRYVSERGFDFIVPPSIQANSDAYGIFVTTMKYLDDVYQTLQALGIRNEDARFVLPNACETEIVITTNFREWRHIIGLRTDSAAQWEISQVCMAILTILKEHAPSCFGDLYDNYTVYNSDDGGYTVKT